MKLELVTRRDVSYVELQRDKKHSLGFTIKDGTQEDSRAVVKSIQNNGPAEKSFAIAKGDVILSVNGFSTTGKTSTDVRRMLDDVGSNVHLQMLYKSYEARIQGSCVYQKRQLTLRLQKIKGGFGFLLRKCSKYSFMMEYPVISNIKEGSPVQKRGHLQDGDRLLMIDNVKLSWLSLAYIASLLQTKSEAEFTFEYSVGVVNFAEMDTKLDLEINIPTADLGISLCMCDEECSMMYISSIRQGSIAERCGVFLEGDVVLSINDVDTKCMTISKAYYLLRNVKKNRKIAFIVSRQKEHEVQTENTGISSTGDTFTTESYISACQNSEWKHNNTPVNSNFMFLEHQKYNFQSLYYTEQLKSVDKFQSILSMMSNLKQALSSLTLQAFKGTQISLNQNCTSCNNAKHTVKLCPSCLARMNVKCAQSLDVLRKLIAHFIRFSSNMFDENDDELVNISLKNVIHMLRETLPNIFRAPELQEHLAVLAKKITSADPSCSICDKEIKTVMLLSKQLLLVLSIRDNSLEFTELAEHLICCLLDVKFPCSGDSGYSINTNSSENSSCSNSENLSETVRIGIDEKLSDDTTSHLKYNSEMESDEISSDNNFSTLQVRTEICHDYLKFTHIQSIPESKNSLSSNSLSETDKFSEKCTGNRTFPKETAAETSFPSLLSDDLTKNRAKKFFKNSKLSKMCRSMGSLTNVRSPDVQKSTHDKNNLFDSQNKTVNRMNIHKSNSTRNKNPVKNLDENINSMRINHCKNTVLNDKNKNSSRPLYKNCKTSDSTNTMYPSSINQADRRNQCITKPTNHTFSKNIPDSNDEIAADFNSESTSSSSRCVTREKNSVGTIQTYPETVNLTLKKYGDSFGLGISDKFDSCELPVIDAIEPKSASHKIGLLKLGDRILAINGVRTSNLSFKKFSVLKRKALAAETITLLVEFDICDNKYIFGLFDVVLDRTLKLGLIFNDVKKDSPMTIRGIEKGSAAHRSGQLFPGDRILFVKSEKMETFDPFTSSFNAEQNITITVSRDPKNVLDWGNETNFKKPDIKVLNPSPCNTNSSSCYTNPCFRQEECLPRSGENFVVKKTAVHSSRKSSLVIDHEVTLYRDSAKFDFGILLSEDPTTGRAYITDIRPDGPAHKSGVIKKFDRIIEINGVLVSGNMENSVLDVLSQANHKVDLLIRKVYREESNYI